MRVRRARRGTLFSRRRKRLLLALMLLTAAAGVILLDIRLRPTVGEIAGAELESIINDEVNRACAEYVRDGATDYSDLVRLRFDRKGKVIGLTTDMTRLNALRADITERVGEKLEHVSRTEISVPLGSVFGVSLLSGTGPMIPVEILHVNRIDSRFESGFQEAGINQTRHRIEMMITVNVVLLLPGGSCEQRCKNRVTVAESVLLGEVPSHYSYFSQFDSAEEAADAYNDYEAD